MTQEKQTWTKVVFSVGDLDPDAIDYISHLFFEAGAIGVEVDYAHGYLENHPNLFGEILEEPNRRSLDHDTEIIAYFENQQGMDSVKETIRDQFADLSYQWLEETIEDQAWQTQWMDYYQPEHLSRYLSIVPVWMKDYTARPDEKVIFLDPGLAFGTGNHPTTQLGGQALEILMRGGETVLDVGTGTGILAFIAKALGAQDVYGYDLDPQAIEAAKQNLNYQPQTQGIEFSVNDLLVGVDHQADIIVANILPHILVNMFADAKKLLKPGGWLVLGGILEEKAAELEETLRVHDWILVQKMWHKGWVGLILKAKVD